MPRTIHLTHDYDAAPDAVWQVATDFGALAEAVKGLITYDSLPSGRIFAGQELAVRFSLFGKLPWQDYFMEVEAMDEDARWFQSHEHGGAVRAWRHHLQVLPAETGARIVESIEIDAGAMTWLYALWGRFMYARRHAPRARMLARMRAK